MDSNKNKNALNLFYERFGLCVISGGSGGLGVEFLELLCGLNKNMAVINLSRREAENPGFSTFINISADFASCADLPVIGSKVKAAIEGANSSGRVLLINNCGIGEYGEFCGTDLEQLLAIVHVNSVAPVFLSKIVVPFIKQNGGAVLNVCSTAAFQPTPVMAVYGASKAFLLNWSIALAAEMEGDGCTVTALCPGPMDTEFFARAGYDSSMLPDSITLSTRAVAEYGLNLLMRGKTHGVAGFKNKVLNAMSRMLPLSLSGKMAKMAMEKSLSRFLKKNKNFQKDWNSSKKALS